MIKTFTCAVCNRLKEEKPDGGTGYAMRTDGSKICYACCAVQEKEFMVSYGKISLYLTEVKNGYRVNNWPGTLVFEPIRHRTGKHNLAGTRVDVWFQGPDGFTWHGVSYGKQTQILHCKRTAQKVKRAA